MAAKKISFSFFYFPIKFVGIIRWRIGGIIHGELMGLFVAGNWWGDGHHKTVCVRNTKVACAKGDFFWRKIARLFSRKKRWVRINFPFLRCLLIATKTVEQFFIHSLDSVHNNRQKKRESCVALFFRTY